MVKFIVLIQILVIFVSIAQSKSNHTAQANKNTKQVIEVSFGAQGSEAEVEPLSQKRLLMLEENTKVEKEALLQKKNATSSQPLKKKSNTQKRSVASEQPRPELNSLIKKYRHDFDEDYQDYKED